MGTWLLFWFRHEQMWTYSLMWIYQIKSKQGRSVEFALTAKTSAANKKYKNT